MAQPETADRYLRYGPSPVLPHIYPGSLDGLTKAIRDVQLASRNVKGIHRLFGVFHKERSLLKIFSDGKELE